MALREGGFGLLPIVDVDPELLRTFRCGKPRLESFLVETGVDLHKDRLGHTTIVFHDEAPGLVVSYFTLSHDGIPLTTSEQGELALQGEISLSSFPAVKLGRLAVNETLQGQGVGEQVMEFVYGEVLDSTALSASRLLIVDADNEPRVISFYEKLGFQKSLWAEKQARNHAPGGRSSTPPAAVKMIKDMLAGP